MPTPTWSLDPVTPETTLGEAAERYISSRPVRTADDRRDGYSPGGLSNLRWGLSFLTSLRDDRGRCLGDVTLGKLKRSHVVAWIEQISRSDLRSAGFTALNALKGLIRWCADADACSYDVVSKTKSRYRPRRGPAITGDEREALRVVLARRRSSIDPSNGDVAVLRVVLETGARCSEIRQARVRHFVPRRRGGDGSLCPPTIRWEVGKNGEPRVVVLSLAAEALIRARVKNLGPDDLIFESPRRPGRPWTHQHLQRVLIDAAVEAGIPNAHELGTHSLRRTYATEAYARGAAKTDVQGALGHDALSSTDGYLRNEVDPGAVRVCDLMNGPRTRRELLPS